MKNKPKKACNFQVFL